MALTACSTKQSAINQLEDFSYELRDHSRNYTIDEWEHAGKKFVKIREKINKHEFDYTAQEKAKIGRLEANCVKYMAKGAKDGVFDTLNNMGEQAYSFEVVTGLIEVYDIFDMTGRKVHSSSERKPTLPPGIYVRRTRLTSPKGDITSSSEKFISTQ